MTEHPAENDAALVERIVATGLHAFLVDLVKSGGRAQASLARTTGLSQKHVSAMLTGKAEGSLSAWTALLRESRVIPPGKGDVCAAVEGVDSSHRTTDGSG